MNPVIEASPQVKQMLLQEQPYTVVLLDTDSYETYPIKVKAMNALNALRRAVVQLGLLPELGADFTAEEFEDKPWMIAAMFLGHHDDVTKQVWE